MDDRTTTIHWLAPASMVGALAAGVVFAGGHHLFYQHLEGQAVSSGAIFGSSISSQQANIAIGTAFAFIIKSCLVFAMSIAFAQLFWREARYAIELPTLSRLDSMYSAFDNIVGLMRVRLWLKYPLLILVAASAWIIPIASIIAPATLSIENAAARPFDVLTRRVPNLDFRSMNFLAAMPHMESADTPSLGSYLYNGPNQPLLETSNAVMSGSRILPITPPAANSSWNLQFHGPSLKCTNVPDSLHQRLRRNIAQGIDDQSDIALYGYLAWFASSGWWGSDLVSDVPFTSDAINKSIHFDGASLAPSLNYNATMFVAALPQVFSVNRATIFEAYNDYNGTTPEWVDGTILQCTLYNSTYNVSFNYIEGQQSIAIDLLDAQNDLEVIPQTSMLGPNPHNILNNGCEGLGSIRSDQTPMCYSNPELLRTMSYQAIMDAFTANLKGTMSVNSNQQLQRESSIMDTALLKTPELSYLRTRAAAATFGNETMQAEIQAINNGYTQGLINKDTKGSSQPLARAIEEMFLNYTISLMSSPALQPNYSSITAPPPAQVTMPAYRNIYVYSATKLWAAYGVAVFLAALSVFIGFVALFLNGASYSHNFSTVFRVARGAEVSTHIGAEDAKGEDPLPKHLVEAQVCIESAGDASEGDEALRYRRQDSRFKPGVSGTVRQVERSPDSRHS